MSDTCISHHRLPPAHPASGYRGSTGGGLSLVGAHGYAWSCAPDVSSSVGGSLLLFDTSRVFPEYHSDRAHGFPVRCVQE